MPSHIVSFCLDCRDNCCRLAHKWDHLAGELSLSSSLLLRKPILQRFHTRHLILEAQFHLQIMRLIRPSNLPYKLPFYRGPSQFSQTASWYTSECSTRFFLHDWVFLNAPATGLLHLNYFSWHRTEDKVSIDRLLTLVKSKLTYLQVELLWCWL